MKSSIRPSVRPMPLSIDMTAYAAAIDPLALAIDVTPQEDSKAAANSSAETDRKGDQSLSYDTAPKPSFDRPYRADRSKDGCITDVRSYGLTVTESSDPYLVDPADRPTCGMRCRYFWKRSVMYPFICLWAGLVSLWQCSRSLLCCRKTYKLTRSDARFTAFFTDVPSFASMIAHEWNQERTELKGHALDLMAMEKLSGVTFDGFKIHGVKVHWKGNWDLESIQVGQLMFHPSDADDWQLAKQQVLYTARYVCQYGLHPFWHFQQETFWNLFRRVFTDEQSVFRRLLQHHSVHMQVTNDRVLNRPESVMNAQDSTCCCWDTQITDRSNIQGVLREYARFFPAFTRKSLYPALQPYYDAVSVFVRSLLKTESDDQWKQDEGKRKQLYADLAHYLGYPADLSATSLEDWADVITQYVFLVSVLHSVDHACLDALSVDEVPMALRYELKHGMKEPSRCCWGYRKIAHLMDECKATMFQYLFLRWWRNRLCCCYSDSRLESTVYDFEDEQSGYKAAATQFRVQLVQAEALVKKQFPNAVGVSIDRVAASIEF